MGELQKAEHKAEATFGRSLYDTARGSLARQEDWTRRLLQQGPWGTAPGQMSPEAFAFDPRGLGSGALNRALSTTMATEQGRLGASQQQAAARNALGGYAGQISSLDQQRAAQQQMRYGQQIAGVSRGQDALQQQRFMQALQGQLQGGQEISAANRLMQMSQQDLPSQAQLQLQQGLEQSISAQRAMAASAQGISPAMAARMAAQGAGQQQALTSQAAAQLRAQEMQQQFVNQMAAAQAAGGLYTGSRGLNIGAMQAGGELAAQARGQTTGELGAAAGIMGQARGQQLGEALGAADIMGGMRAQDIAREQGYLGGQLGMTELGSNLGMGLMGAEAETRRAQMAAGQQFYSNLLGMQQQQINAAQGYQPGYTPSGWERYGAPIVGGLFSAGGQFAGGYGTGLGYGATTSDKRLKKKIDRKTAKSDIYKFLDKLKAAKYEYKDPEVDGRGARYGVMAQELAKTPVGQTMVEEHPRGLMINFASGMSTMLAAQADLHRRLKRVEGHRKAA